MTSRTSPICSPVDPVLIQQEGPGWRLVQDLSRGPFCVLVGGHDWAFELTLEEWDALSDVVLTLVDQHRALADQLMDEESIELELDRSPWWGCLDGTREAWGLSVVLTASASRSVEATWRSPAAQAMAAAMQTLRERCH